MRILVNGQQQSRTFGCQEWMTSFATLPFLEMLTTGLNRLSNIFLHCKMHSLLSAKKM